MAVHQSWQSFAAEEWQKGLVVVAAAAAEDESGQSLQSCATAVQQKGLAVVVVAAGEDSGQSWQRFAAVVDEVDFGQS